MKLRIKIYRVFILCILYTSAFAFADGCDSGKESENIVIVSAEQARSVAERGDRIWQEYSKNKNPDLADKGARLIQKAFDFDSANPKLRELQSKSLGSLAEIEMEKGDFNQALELIAESSKLDPDNPFPYHVCTTIWMIGENWKNALKCNLREISLLSSLPNFEPYTPTAWTNLSEIYFNLHDFGKTVEQSEKAVFLFQKFKTEFGVDYYLDQQFEVEYRLAISYEKLGRKKDAIYAYTYFLKLAEKLENPSVDEKSMIHHAKQSIHRLFPGN